MAVTSKIVSGLTARGIKKLLEKAEITPNGSNPWEPQIIDNAFYDIVAEKGMLGLGDSYMKGLWECEDLSGFFFRAIRAGLLEEMAEASPMKALLDRFRTSNPQALGEAEGHIVAHYTRRNNLFEVTLDELMAYTCAIWENPLDTEDADTLDQAQKRKFKLICDKLGLKPGMRLLDLGCGWGGLMAYAVEHYGVKAVGVTLAQDQIDFINERFGHLEIETHLADYRELGAEFEGRFDRVVSVGMLEHIGEKNLRVWMEVANRCLKDGGLALTQNFGRSDAGIPLVDPWTHDRIFPGIYLPTVTDLAKASEGIFNMLDLDERGIHYYKTLLAWAENFEKNWPKIADQYGEEFYRMWRYYLLSCAGAFLARKVLLWQIVWAKKEDLTEDVVLYRSVRR